MSSAFEHDSLQYSSEAGTAHWHGQKAHLRNVPGSIEFFMTGSSSRLIFRHIFIPELRRVSQLLRCISFANPQTAEKIEARASRILVLLAISRSPRRQSILGFGMA
jgi:hypothetical protein